MIMKKPLHRRAYFWTSLICLCFGAFWAYKAVSSFASSKRTVSLFKRISSNRQPNPAWDVHVLTDEEHRELDGALAQQYHYLACGNQAFAFLSEDGRYVLKFFKQKLFEAPFLEMGPIALV